MQVKLLIHSSTCTNMGSTIEFLPTIIICKPILSLQKSATEVLADAAEGDVHVPIDHFQVGANFGNDDPPAPLLRSATMMMPRWCRR